MPGGMFRYVARRLALILPVFLLASALLFSLLYLKPGSPAEKISPPTAGPATVERIKHDLGLDKPPYIRYFEWLGGVLHGDFGKSFVYKRPVSAMILERLPRTLMLTIGGLLVSIAIGIPLGVIAALHRKTKVDYTAMGGALFGISIPNFWLGLILILVFGVWLGWPPGLGQGVGPLYLILPSITLGTALAGTTSRLTRSSLLDHLHRDYVRALRARGLKERTVIYGHAVKNSFIPVATLLALRIKYLFGGSIIIEKVFGWSGMGLLMITSIFDEDFLVIQGIALVFVVLVIIGNLLADISYAYLNPKVRYGEE